jgi:hypothetical protein
MPAPPATLNIVRRPRAIAAIMGAMETRELTWNGLVLVLPPGWDQAVDETVGEEAPLTLVREEDDKGVLQFSVMGDAGNAGAEGLLQRLRSFGVGHKLGPATDVVQEEGRVAGSYRTGDDFIRVWYFTDGPSVALATYVAEPRGYEEELAQAEQIVRTVRFVTEGGA